jgi:mRNA interferase RelE/StbE
MLPLEIDKRAADFIEDLQAKPFKQVMGKILHLLKTPFPQDSRPLQGYPGLFRVDIGEYRVIYEPDPAEAPALIRVILAGKRNDDQVYKELRRILGD